VRTRLHLNTACDCPASTISISVHNSVYEYSATVCQICPFSFRKAHVYRRSFLMTWLILSFSYTMQHLARRTTKTCTPNKSEMLELQGVASGTVEL